MAMFYNKLGIGALCLSFIGSFWFGRFLRKTKEKKTIHFVANLGQSMGTLWLFLATTWHRGTVEETLANKYLWMLNDKEIDSFEVNSNIYLQRIMQYQGGQMQFQQP